MSQAAVSTVGVLAQGLARFGYSVLIGRFMGPSDLAHVSAWLALALILSLLWPTGAGNAASHFLAHARALGHTPVHALRLIQRSFLVSCLGMLAIGIPVGVLALGASLGDAIAIGALIIAYSGYILARGIEVGLGRIRRAAIWDVVSALVTMALLTVVLVVQLSWAVLWPITIGYAVFAVHTWLRAHRGHEELRQESVVEAASIWKLTSWNSVGLLASNGLIQFAMVYVFIVVTPADAGVFAAAMSLATPASMLSQAISQVLIPRFSEWAAADAVASRGRYLAVLGGMVALLAVVFGIVALASGLIVSIVYGAEYAASAVPMALLLGGVFAFSVGLVATAYLLTTGRTAIATIWSIAGLVLGLVVMVAGTAPLGGIGAACAGVIAGYALTTVGVVGASVRRGQLAPSGSASVLG
jgi:O-antigen/teichoic acid export membrane protein